MTAISSLPELFLPRKLPPTERDRSIYTAVAINGQRQAEAAKAFGVSQPRIAQIVRDVQAWMEAMTAGVPVQSAASAHPEAEEQAGGDVWAALPATPSLGELPRDPQLRLQLAEEIAYARYENVYQVAMSTWRKSLEDSQEHRSRDVGEVHIEEHITKTQTGKVGLLNQAMRAASASARLLGVDLTGKEARKRAQACETGDMSLASQPIGHVEESSDQPVTPSQESAGEQTASEAAQVDQAAPAETANNSATHGESKTPSASLARSTYNRENTGEFASGLGRAEEWHTPWEQPRGRKSHGAAA